MDDLTLQETLKYETLWRDIPEYRGGNTTHPDYRGPTSTDYLVPFFLDLFQKWMNPGDSIIDFGCGTGRSALPLLNAHLQVHLFDLCANCLDPEIFLLSLGEKPPLQFTQGCLWNLPEALPAADWLICFDVLEHLPEEKVAEALLGMSSRMKRGGLLNISLVEDLFGAFIGQKLHLTVKPASWWREMIARFFSISAEIRTHEHFLLWAIAPK